VATTLLRKVEAARVNVHIPVAVAESVAEAYTPVFNVSY
jgi:hypothetical protein